MVGGDRRPSILDDPTNVAEQHDAVDYVSEPTGPIERVRRDEVRTSPRVVVAAKSQ
jgi:hypothetical protein